MPLLILVVIVLLLCQVVLQFLTLGMQSETVKTLRLLRQETRTPSHRR